MQLLLIKTRRLLATDGHLLNYVSIHVQPDWLTHVNTYYLSAITGRYEYGGLHM